MQTENIFIAHPTTADQINALKAFLKSLKIKFEVTKEKPYNPEFVDKIRRSEQDFEAGRFKEIKAEDLKKYIEGL